MGHRTTTTLDPRHRHPGTRQRQPAPHLTPRPERSLRAARLRAERAALVATLPPDPTGTLRHGQQRAATIRHELDELRAGAGRHTDTPIGEAARRLHGAEHNHRQAQRLATAPHLGRRVRRSRLQAALACADELAAARHEWNTVAGAIEHQLVDALADAQNVASRLQASKVRRALDRMSDSRVEARIAAIDRELEGIDAPHPRAAPAVRPAEISNGLGLSL